MWRKYVVFVVDAPELGPDGFVLAAHKSFSKAERKAFEYSEYGRVGVIPTYEPIRCGDFVKFTDSCADDVVRVNFDV